MSDLNAKTTLTKGQRAALAAAKEAADRNVYYVPKGARCGAANTLESRGLLKGKLRVSSIDCNFERGSVVSKSTRVYRITDAGREALG